MSRCVVCVFACLAMLLGASSALAEGIVAEVYRSPHGWPRGAAVDPSDGSCWVISGTSMVHLDAEGNIVGQYTGAGQPIAVAVHAGDGSCWIANYDGRQLVHLSRDGSELWRGVYSATDLSVDQRDGSVWLVNRADLATSGSVVHVSADGEQLGIITAIANPGRVAASSFDGTLWAWDMGHGSPDVPAWRLVHLAADGTALGEWPGFGGPVSVDSTDGSCWAGSYNTGVIHISAGNGVLWTGTDYRFPTDVAANSADGSCWVQFFPTDVIENCGQTLVLLASDGSELRRFGPPDQRLRWQFGVLAVSAVDGTLWTGAGEGWAHLAADGTVLQQDRGLQRPFRVSVSPTDGSYWMAGGQDCSTTPDPPWIAHYDALGNELWRKTGLIAPDDPAPDPVDGSVWIADTVSVMHFAADGTQLPFAITYGSYGPYHVMVDPRDRSVWICDTNLIKHYETDGTLLQTITYDHPVYDCELAPDGSLWARAYNDAFPDEYTGAILVHFVPDGTSTEISGILQLQSFSVSPLDGSVWTSDHGVYEGEPLPPRRVTHLAANGTVLWQSGTEYDPYYVAVDPRNGNCWVAGFDAYLLSPDGEELGRTEHGSYVPYAAAAGPVDGTLWLIDQSSQLCKVASTGPFSDIAVTSWAAQAVSLCAAAGVVRGYWDGTYRPGDQVTRDQMAVYLARALCGSDADVPEGPSTPSFGDVGSDSWAYKQIEYCKAQNIVQGYGGNYQPGLALDRAQMAVFLARAMVTFADRPDLASYTAPSVPSFADVAPDFWAYKAIEYVRLRYVARGYWDGRYRPDDACTRDQMAVFMARAFHLFQ